ncbi:MAG: DJ-1/PfpI family protein [bacterium]|nr:DJ-1/PfpI family protein [bacterium]
MHQIEKIKMSDNLCRSALLLMLFIAILIMNRQVSGEQLAAGGKGTEPCVREGCHKEHPLKSGKMPRETLVSSPLNIAIFIYENADELDIFGPREVFGIARIMSSSGGGIFLVAETAEPVTLAGGTKVIPDYAFDNAPKPDIFIVPGGTGSSKQAENPKVTKYISNTAKNSRWIVGVCTGSILLAEAGPAKGKQTTTHHLQLDKMRKINGVENVREGVRYVQDGNLVTSAGVSAGIDLSLWLTEQVYGADVSDKVKSIIEYYPDQTVKVAPIVKTGKKMPVDPVCGMEVDEKTVIKVEKDGNAYYFCCEACKQKFLEK